MDQTTFELHIEKIVPQGYGLGFQKGLATFVPFTAPGDHIRAQVQKTHRQHLFAHCVEVLSSGPGRQDPGCSVFTQCGGCQLRHMHGSVQRQAKEGFMVETLERFTNLRGLTPIQPMLTTGHEDGYRRRASFKVRWVASRLLLGFFQSASHRIADLPGRCPVLVNRLEALLEPLRALLTSLTLRDRLPQVDAVTGQEDIGCIFHLLAPPTAHDLQQLQQFAKQHGITQLWLQRGRKTGLHPVVTSKELYYTVAQHTLTFHPGDFIQAHAIGNQLLVEEALVQAGTGKMAWDLFCGIGNFTVPLAGQFTHVLGVEGYAPALQRARNNAAHSPFKTIRFRQLDLFKDEEIEQLATEQPADLVLLDPPREGALQLVKWLTTQPVQRILYVSCNPATFARDAAILVHGGLQLLRVQPLDLFPQTFHLELVALFARPT